MPSAPINPTDSTKRCLARSLFHSRSPREAASRVNNAMIKAKPATTWNKADLRRPAIVIFSLLHVAFSAWAEHTVSFVGPDMIHIRAWHKAVEDEVSYTETLIDPSGNETVLLQGASTGVAIRIDADPPNGVWNCHVRIETVDKLKNHHVSESDTPFTVADGIGGTLLFSESLPGLDPDNERPLNTIIVKSGLTLNLSGDWSGSFAADGGQVVADNGLFSAFFSAYNSGSIEIGSAAQVSGGTLGVSDSGSMTVASGAIVSGATFELHDGTFNPGNAVGFSGNTYKYYNAGLSGYGPLHSASGRIILAPGSEGAQMSGEDYTIIMRTTPIHFSISKCTLEIETSANISSGVEDCWVTVGQPVIPSTFSGDIALTGLNLYSLALWGAEKCVVSRCEIRGGTTVCMGQPELTDNIFIGGCNIFGGSAARISDNAFHGTLTFLGWDATLPRPEIEDNDFLSPAAVQYRSNILFPGTPGNGDIQIGRAYYGGSRGPTLKYGGGFLGLGGGDQAGWVSIDSPGSAVNRHEYFSLATFSPKRMTGLDPQHYPPPYWVAGWASGQGELEWYGEQRFTKLYKNIPTLVSFDVKTTARLASCPDIFLRLNGSTRISPETKPQLSRDLADFNKTRVRLGGTTVNFRVPETGDSSVNFELVVVNSAGEEQVLVNSKLEFIANAWTRALRVAVIPIGVEYTFSSIQPPPAAPMSRFLQYVLPSMLPIPHGKLQTELKSPEWMETNVGLLSNLPGLAALAGKLSLWYVDALANPKYDLVVAVMPPGSIRILSKEIDYFLNLTQPASGVNYGYGDNFWLSTPRVLFVDSEAPMAAIHELGHAAGLYRDREQYDMPEYKQSEGMPLRGFSSAALDEQLGNVINGFPASGIVHFAETNMTWYAEKYEWIDVMGLPETQVWPSRATSSGIMGFFNGLLSATSASGADVAQAPPQKSSEERTTDASPESTNFPTRENGQTTIAISGIAMSPWGQTLDLTPGNRAMEESLLPFTVPELEPASNWYQYGVVRFYDGSGQVLAEPDFDLPPVYNESTWWSGAFPLPPGCVRYSLFGHRGSTETLKTTWQKAGELMVQIDRSLLPLDLGQVLNLAWRITASDAQPESRFTSQVLFSTNNGANWSLMGTATDALHRSFPTDTLPRTDTLALRVVVSDGFASAQDTVTGLRVGDRPPTLVVTEPRDGDIALAGHLWNLQARAWDPEDGELEISWWSSKDGKLNPSTTLTVGFHTLTCTAIDTAGRAVPQSIAIQVVPNATTTDLTLESLTLLGKTHEFRNNWSLSSGALLPGEINVVDCVIRNSGIQTTGIVSMIILQPDGQEVILAPLTLELEPFDHQRARFAFVPQAFGSYRLSVAVHPLGLHDRTPANNTRTIDTFTYTPRLLVNPGYPVQELLFISRRYDHPYPPPNDFIIPTQVSDSVVLYNGGRVPLVISNTVLTCGLDFYGVDHFRIYPKAPQFPVTLQPGGELELGLQFYGKTLLPEATGLRVTSNDPRRPDFEIPIHGWINPPDNDTWRDHDMDGLPDYLEIGLGLDPKRADTDKDGLLDGMEDRNGNGIREPWETDALVADTDGDGLLDGDEDVNGNGGHDGRETSALLADSDGDGLKDAEEAHCRTDGLNAGDGLRLEPPLNAGSDLVLRWHARSSVSYEVQSSSDLIHWNLSPSGTADDQQASRTPKVDGHLEYRTQRQRGAIFYRVVVLKR